METLNLVYLNVEHTFLNIDGHHWTLAEPVVNFLGFGENTSRALKRHCREHHYRTIRVDGVEGRSPLYVTLAGLVRLSMRSDHERAIDFQDWVTDIVVPQVLYKGGYIAPDATREQLTNLQSDISTRLSAFESAYTLCKDQGDERGMLFIKDQVQNLADKLNHLDSDIPQDWLSVSEVLERRGYTMTKLIRNSLAQIGKNVKKAYESDTGLAVKVTSKAVGSGHKSDDIKVYPPDWHERIEQVAVSYWQSRGITY